MNAVLKSVALGAHVTSVVRGAAFPAAGVVVIAVPLAALAFYFFVVRRNRDR